MTCPCEEKTGVDQQACRPWGKAASRKLVHNESVAMSSTTTCSPTVRGCAARADRRPNQDAVNCIRVSLGKAGRAPMLQPVSLHQ